LEQDDGRQRLEPVRGYADRCAAYESSRSWLDHQYRFTCGRQCLRTITAYTASKGAVDAFSRAAAIELAGYNIRVNSVNPGVIHSAMVDEAFPTREAMDEVAAAQPLRRMGRPIDVAYLVLYLASDESWFTTATSQIIDGGLSVMGGVSPIVECD